MFNHEFPDVLQGALWHTTSLERFHKIITTGFILSDPPAVDVPEDERWCTGQGPEGYSYVRTLGGISLFEFNDFDPVNYSKKCPASCWEYFVPYKHSWGTSVWIEIDRDQLADQFLSAEELIKRWHEESSNMIMPHIEAACLAPIALKTFRRVLTAGEDQPNFEELTFI